jgi:hypothetical protein
MLAASLPQAFSKPAKEACASLELEPRSKLARACTSLRKLADDVYLQARASLRKLADSIE